jgi:DNA-directed RNA polymerase specialized sigma24 family protein
MPWRSEGQPRGRIDGRTWRSALGWRTPAPPPAFRRAVLAHLDAAYNLARWLICGEPDAEDVVCEAMARVLASPRALDRDEAGLWVLRSVRGVVYARLGIEASRPPMGEPVETEASTLQDVDPVALLEVVKAPGRMDALLGRLPIELRECLVLCELHHAGYGQIAAIAGIEIDDVRQRLWRGRRLLARLAADLVGDSSAKRE